MIKIVYLVSFLVFIATSAIADRKIVCYYGSWAAYRPGKGKFEVSEIEPKLCTHLIYTFIGVSTEGDVQILDAWMDLPDGKDGFGKFTRLRQASPDSKIMIAMGGWNEGSIKYSQVASNPATRAKFVRNVVQFLQQYNFDGFDLDWEYPNQRGGQAADKQNFVALLRELRQEFDKHGFLLSIASAAAQSSAAKSYIISQVAQYVHFINLMTYDFNGSWNRHTGLNAPLYSSSKDCADAAVGYWLSQGAPADKIILGIPAYGRSFTLSNPSNTGIGAPARGAGTAGPYTREAGMLGYNEICQYVKQGWTVRRSDADKTPYAFNGDQWVGYDDVESIAVKAAYINSKNLGGAMVWSIETDDFSGSCGSQYPLLVALNKDLRGNTPVPTFPPVTTSKPGEATIPSPSDNICTKEGFARHPSDCTRFYQCIKVVDHYVAYEFRCSAGTVFDPKTNTCNYRYLVPGC
ncbi:chitinase-3-like protein 1 [Megachile rotundata]|uniref:chitinase-3-like protein 1 n=1 Tax=Megachile rotundata TaxID=143995 RepID=UPI000614B576|nr:PREDICTED: acidic mammalian chitinase [Megachile rotundata]